MAGCVQGFTQVQVGILPGIQEELHIRVPIALAQLPRLHQPQPCFNTEGMIITSLLKSSRWLSLGITAAVKGQCTRLGSEEVAIVFVDHSDMRTHQPVAAGFEKPCRGLLSRAPDEHGDIIAFHGDIYPLAHCIHHLPPFMQQALSVKVDNVKSLQINSKEIISVHNS